MGSIFCSRALRSLGGPFPVLALLVVVSGFSGAAAGKEDGLKVLDAKEAALMLEREEAVIIDNRPPQLFEAGHIPRAINMTYFRPGSVQNRLTEAQLKPFKGRTLIFYCSGGSRAYYAARKALEWGISPDVFWFKGGWPEWREHKAADTNFSKQEK